MALDWRPEIMALSDEKFFNIRNSCEGTTLS